MKTAISIALAVIALLLIPRHEAIAQNPQPCASVQNSATTGQVLSAKTNGRTPACQWISAKGTGSVTSITATLPIVVTPSPLTSTGVISCPTCGGSGTITEYIELPINAPGNPASSPGVLWSVSSATHPFNDSVSIGTAIGGLDFEAARGQEDDAYQYLSLPSTWTGNIDIILHTFGHSGTAGNAFMKAYAGCGADGTATPPSFNAASTSTVAYPNGVAGNFVTVTFTSVAVTNCAAGSVLSLKVGRDSSQGADTFAGSVHLFEVELVRRHT